MLLLFPIKSYTFQILKLTRKELRQAKNLKDKQQREAELQETKRLNELKEQKKARMKEEARLQGIRAEETRRNKPTFFIEEKLKVSSLKKQDIIDRLNEYGVEYDEKETRKELGNLLKEKYDSMIKK